MTSSTDSSRMAAPQISPPWWHERAALRTKALDCEVEKLRTALPAFEDIRVAIIFGSYAQQRVGPESDLDLLLVCRDTAERGARLLSLRSRIDDIIDVPYDLLAYNEAEFQRFRTTWAIVAEADEHGIRIVDRLDAV